MPLTDDLQNRIDHGQRLLELTKRFPDMSEDTDRWRTVRLKSKAINAIATDVLFKHNCGCCSDSPLEAWPHATVDGVVIFSEPPCFQVGEKCYDGGEREYAIWDEKMRVAGISESAIQRVRKYLDAHKPEEEDDD